MGNKKHVKFLPGLVLASGLALAAMTNGCSDATDALGGCDEFKGGGVANLQIDGKVKAFVQAAADLDAIATNMKADVKASCIAIATDMGATDTWSAKGDSDDAITEACNAASAKIKATLQAAGQANVSIQLQVSGGQCTVDAKAQIECEGQCKVDASCTEPSVDVRCDPGQLAVQCEGTCNAEAVCEGSVTAQANCNGSCSAQCTGKCSGECVGKCDGNDQNGGTCAGQCQGSCSGTCEGTCTGECKLAANANINCGANVDCRGGCTGNFKEPECRGELKPPKCEGDANCQASCSSSAQFKAQCTPPQAKLVIVGNASGQLKTDIDKLQVTLEKNLPKILLAAKTQGQLALKGAGEVASRGAGVIQAAGSLGGKAIACVRVAAEASVKASASVNVSVQASASVSGSASAGS